MVVVDGLQRLSTFKNFVEDGLRLRLPNRPDLDGKHFAELPPLLQNRVEDCNLTLYVIDAKAPEQARLDIFDRVNSEYHCLASRCAIVYIWEQLLVS